MHRDTMILEAGYPAPTTAGAFVPPLQFSSTFTAPGDPSRHQFTYGRFHNPTWAVWEEGRLAGVEAEKTGEFHAANHVTDGSSIQINARTQRRGKIEVQLVQKDEVLPDFSFADCVPITGDKMWETVQWKGKKDLSELKGKKFQIHFRLNKAKIFGYRTVTGPQTTK